MVVDVFQKSLQFGLTFQTGGITESYEAEKESCPRPNEAVKSLNSSRGSLTCPRNSIESRSISTSTTLRESLEILKEKLVFLTVIGRASRRSQRLRRQFP